MKKQCTRVAFYMVGTIEEAIEKAKKIEKEIVVKKDIKKKLILPKKKPDRKSVV